jgi:plastocyanin
VRRAALLSAAAASGALALAGPAAAATTQVSMPGKFFDPARFQLVAGDHVLFVNSDLVTHDVRVPLGPFDSGPMSRGARWDQAFETAGSYPYLCTLHPFMSGTAEVVNATIAAAPERLVAGEKLTISGRAPAGTAQVGLVRANADGTSTTLPGAAPAADGTYAITTTAAEGARYRVTTPRGDSPEIAPQVSARVEAHVSVRHRGRKLVVEAHTMPAAPGLFASLQLYDRWHYRWRGRRTAKLDADGMAAFTLPGSTRTYARVVLRRSKGGTALATSGVVRSRNGKPARDPDTIRPAHGGGHGSGGGEGAGGGHGGHGGP